MVQMRVQGGHRQIVLVMLQGGQALGQVAFMVVVDIRQIGHAMSGRMLYGACASRCERTRSRTASERFL